MLNMLAVGEKNQDKIENLELASTEIFLLTRLVANLKGSEVNRMIEALPKKKRGDNPDIPFAHNANPSQETSLIEKP